MAKLKIGSEGIRDARQLGAFRMLLLGIQHTFAMFGATVLVPLLTGLDIATTLLMAGLGTLLFHLITGKKVPAFLGSSFAFLGGYAAIAPMLGENGDIPNTELLPYACLGVAAAGLVYLVLALLIKLVGIKRVMKFFPPVVTGPIIIAIGLSLAGTAIANCQTNWTIAVVALVTVIVFNVFGRGMLKILPILIGIIVSYCVAVYMDLVDFAPVTEIAQNISNGQIFGEKALIGIPINMDMTIFAIDWSNTSLIVSAIVAIVPISLATMMEHIGDISAISATCNENYIKDPGLHRTLTGDGLATTFSAVFGGPANTTYGENTGVLALSRVYDPAVIRIAAFFAVGISFFPIVSAAISTIPSAIIGGISFILYGMISAVGMRNVVEAKVDFSKSRNLMVAAVILVCALGIDAIEIPAGAFTINLTALAVAAIAGIVLNAILPGKDYVFDDGEKLEKSEEKDENVAEDVKTESAVEDSESLPQVEMTEKEKVEAIYQEIFFKK